MKEQNRPESAAQAAESEPKTALPESETGAPMAEYPAPEPSAPEPGVSVGAESAPGAEAPPAARGAEDSAAPKVAAEVLSAGISAQKEAQVSPAGEAAAEDGQASDRKKQSRKNLIAFLVSAVIIGCVVFALIQLSNTLQQGDSATFAELLEGMNWWYILIVAGLALLMFATDSLKYVVLTRCYGNKLKISKCMKVALIGKYYDNITPTASGGQPMQIYYFYRNGISGAQGSSITFMKYGVQMLAVGIVCVLLLACGVGTLQGMLENEAMHNTILICGWIGFGINAIIPFFVAFVVFCPRAVSWVINLFVKLLHKIKIVKHADKIEGKIRAWLDRFAEFSQFIVKHPKVFFQLLLLCFFEPVLQYLIPYFLLVAMIGPEVMGMHGWELLFTVAVLACYATNAAVFIPTPGNSGAIETVFMLAFTAVASSVLFWYVLVWRFVLYYVYIVLGIGMNIFDVGIKFRDSRRARRAVSEKNRS